MMDVRRSSPVPPAGFVMSSSASALVASSARTSPASRCIVTMSPRFAASTARSSSASIVGSVSRGPASSA